MGIKKGFLFFFLLGMFAAPSLPDHGPDKNQLRMARECLDYMSYEPAAEILGRILSKQPKKKGLRPLLAYAFFHLDRSEEAAKVLEDEILLYPDDFDAFILLGYIYFLSGRFDLAENICRDFENVVEKAKRAQARKEGLDLHHINHLDIYSRKQKYFLQKVSGESRNMGLPYFILGICSKRKGEHKKAIQNFHSALDGGYDPVDGWSRIIDIELDEGRWQAALKLNEEAMAANGPQAEFHFLMGYACCRLIDLEGAAEGFGSAVKLKPYFTEGIKNLGKIYLLKNEPEKAASLFKKVLKIGPYDLEAHRLLQSALRNDTILYVEVCEGLSKDWDASRPVRFRHSFVTDINKINSGIKTSAMDLLKAGRINAAGNLIKDFLGYNDRCPKLHYNLAKIYENKNDMGKALEHAWRARELNGNFKEAYDLVAAIFFKLEDFQNALHFYQKVFDFDPQDAMSSFNLGCTYSALNDSEKAEKCWKTAISNEKLKSKNNKDTKTEDNLEIDITVNVWPVSFEARKSLGRLYQEQNQSDKALLEFLKAIELVPENPEAYFEAGKIYLGQIEEAKAAFYFDKYLALGGDKENLENIILKKKDI